MIESNNEENCVLVINGEDVTSEGSSVAPLSIHLKDNGSPERKALIDRIKTFDKDKVLSLGYMIRRYSDGSVEVNNFPSIADQEDN